MVANLWQDLKQIPVLVAALPSLVVWLTSFLPDYESHVPPAPDTKITTANAPGQGW